MCGSFSFLWFGDVPISASQRRLFGACFEHVPVPLAVHQQQICWSITTKITAHCDGSTLASRTARSTKAVLARRKRSFCPKTGVATAPGTAPRGEALEALEAKDAELERPGSGDLGSWRAGRDQTELTRHSVHRKKQKPSDHLGIDVGAD